LHAAMLPLVSNANVALLKWRSAQDHLGVVHHIVLIPIRSNLKHRPTRKCPTTPVSLHRSVSARETRTLPAAS
jgi:hypothetical protein